MREKLRVFLLSCGIISPSLFIVVYLVVYLIESAVLSGFTSLRLSLSELSTNFVIFIICGVLIICFAFGLGLFGVETKIVTWRPCLLGLVGVGLLLSGIFVNGTVQSYLHTTLLGDIRFIGDIAVFVPLLVACCVFAWGFTVTGQWKSWPWAVYSGIIAFLMLVFFVWAFTIARLYGWPASLYGWPASLLERLSISIGMFWVLCFGFRQQTEMFRQQLPRIALIFVSLIILIIWELSAQSSPILPGNINITLNPIYAMLGAVLGFWALFPTAAPSVRAPSVPDRGVSAPSVPDRGVLAEFVERSGPNLLLVAVFFVALFAFFAYQQLLAFSASRPSPKPPPTLIPTSTPTPTPQPIQVPFQVTFIGMSVSPLSIAAIHCGTQLTVTYTATFHALPSSRGGAVQIRYTTDGGRTTKSGLVQFSPGETSKQFQFKSTGTLAQNSAFPGVGQVTTTSPNALFSQALTPGGSCTPVPTPIPTPTQTPTPRTVVVLPAPTPNFWYWLQLLIVPVVLVIGGFGLIVLIIRGFRLQRRIALDNQGESALQAYLHMIDRIDEYSSEEDKKRLEKTIRARTLLLLRSLTIPRLDAERKGSVLQFLYESHLIGNGELTIPLRGADLSGANLSNADLHNANLSGADLSMAGLSGANLSGANLSGANLSEISLNNALILDADLSSANLSRANLIDADLSGANLSRASLEGALLRNTNLRDVKGLDD